MIITNFYLLLPISNEGYYGNAINESSHKCT